MRTIILSALFIACGLAMNAQKLSLTPQVGFENSKTSVNYNDLGFFAPLGGELNPQISLRLDYKFKQGFGPYIGASTSRSGVLYSFNNIENGMNEYTAVRANMQVRMESGFQYTSMPIFFNKTKQSLGSSASKTKSSTKSSYGSYSYRSSCSKKYSSQSSRCQNKNSSAKKAESKNKGAWVRLQPSVGVGFIPSPQADVVEKMEGAQTTYEYRAGNWNTAFLTGMGFEFGRDNQRLVNISVNYFTGIGNLNTETVSSISGTKTSIAHLESKASGWNVRIGIPFTLAEKKAAKQKSEPKTKKTSYDKTRIQYKYRCRM